MFNLSPANEDSISIRMEERLLRLDEVKIKTGLTKQSIYIEIKAGRFPSPYQLTQRSVGWKLSEINEWVDSRQKAKN